MDRGVLAKAETMAQRTILTEAEAAFIDAQRVARLATADAEGNPHVIPVCYAFDGERFYTPLDEKPKRVTGGPPLASKLSTTFQIIWENPSNLSGVRDDW